MVEIPSNCEAESVLVVSGSVEVGWRVQRTGASSASV